MTETYKKKLIEVAIPLEAINAASAREKSIRHGHPSTLHLWWARRPLAACRAVLFAQLVDDPSSHPDKFPTEEAVEIERKRLFKIIEDLVVWENSTNEEVLERARAEIRKSCDGELPPIYDPFSGGGSIPLEAQRLGLPAFGSDLNPVAVMIGKAMVEIPPKFRDMEPIHPGAKSRNHYRNAEGLAEDVKYYGEWMREMALERIGHLYPQVNIPSEYGGGKATVIAWIWARTVPSPDPAFSKVDVPLVRSFDLSTKKGNKFWVEPVVDNGDYRFEIRSEHRGDKQKGTKGTVNRQGGRCVVSDAAMPFKYIRQQAKNGKMGQRLLALVAEGSEGRVFISPDSFQSEIALAESPIEKPNISISHWPGRTNVVEYGMTSFGDLFTDRQLVALNTFSELVREACAKIEKDATLADFTSDTVPLREGGKGAKAYAEAVSVYLGFATCRAADFWSSNATWESSGGFISHVFTRQAIPMIWDFAEGNPFSSGTGSWDKTCLDWIFRVLNAFVPRAQASIVQQSAQTATVPSNACISTDPPYYDNIGYADLSDFFYFWQKKALQESYPSEYSFLATPKSEEIIASPYRHEGRELAEQFFLNEMRDAVKNLAKHCSDDFPTTIYYAFKQNEISEDGISSAGWATFLQAIIEAGYAVVGTWPVRTERSARMIALGNNALASSVVLVCRKKQPKAAFASRAEFVRELKRELPAAISKLQASNISPADMPQSAIGPGIGVFSRYRAVLESDDTTMDITTALQLINRELDEFLNDVQGEFDADTRFAITWYEQNGTKAGDYGTANNIATARGIAVESVKHAGIVESSAGKVRILERDELLEDWDPLIDTHLTIWECLQYLVHEHEENGISHDAAVLLKKMEDKAEAIKDLAYCLYDICANKRQDAQEATAYNALIADWAELSRQAAAIDDVSGERQTALDL
jgi:putative DNA methylase